MSSLPLCFRRWLSWLGWLSLVAAGAGAEETFTALLTPVERAGIGVEKLDDDQRAALNAQVQREVRLARQGDVIAFAGTFTSRRPASERVAAGLEQLTAEETAQLDTLVARQLAQRPTIIVPRTEAGANATTVTKSRAQWHGVLSATYGRGSGGREFYGASVTSIYDDPEHNFTAAITLARYHGDWFYDDGFGCRSGRGWRR
ncbi:MAG TPA: hypothetical protein VHF69_02925 [Candidatus Synoicihabitans sp.]|nr:hypothetical protein [Candidatus Synoicihabitans sp.]